VSDLDRALRDLLTDEHLDLPARPDAVRIVHDGVRRRRRHRALAISLATATAVGATVAAALALPAALTADGPHRTTPVQPDQQYDVAWVDQSAPDTWSPKPRKPKPPTMDAPRCLAGQLRAEEPVDNSGGGIRFTSIRLRNISSSPCLLIGTPPRVAAQAPGRPDIVATRGLSLGSSGVGGDLKPGKLGYLTIQTARDCSSTATYSSLSVTLPSGTSMSIPMTVDAGCGLKTGGLGVDEPPPTTPVDPRSYLRATIEAPDTATAGQVLSFVVSLTNPTDSAVSLSHCPGYVATLGPSKEVLSLNCAGVRSIDPGQSIRYEMRLVVRADEPPGPQSLTWVLLLADQPSLVSTTVLVQQR
jgi:hypothetical protein